MRTYDAARSKTKSAIVQAFWELYLLRDISKITVKDISEAAGIHRATFYLYFDSVYAVLDSIKSEQLEKLKKVCSYLRLKNCRIKQRDSRKAESRGTSCGVILRPEERNKAGPTEECGAVIIQREGRDEFNIIEKCEKSLWKRSGDRKSQSGDS